MLNKLNNSILYNQNFCFLTIKRDHRSITIYLLRLKIYDLIIFVNNIYIIRWNKIINVENKIPFLYIMYGHSIDNILRWVIMTCIIVVLARITRLIVGVHSPPEIFRFVVRATRTSTPRSFRLSFSDNYKKKKQWAQSRCGTMAKYNNCV